MKAIEMFTDENLQRSQLAQIMLNSKTTIFIYKTKIISSTKQKSISNYDKIQRKLVNLVTHIFT